MPSPSKYLSATGYRGLGKLGNALIPGDDELPSFLGIGCAEHVDQILEYMPESDRRDLGKLLGVLGYLPSIVIVALVYLLEWCRNFPGPLGGQLRFLRMGIKGLIFTLYYSGQTGNAYDGPSPLDALAYEVQVYTGDLDPDASEREGTANERE